MTDETFPPTEDAARRAAVRRGEIASRAVALSCAGVVAIAAFNFFADRDAATAMAETTATLVACNNDHPCRPALVRLEKTPIWSDYRFLVRGAAIEIRCQRAAYLVGALRCHPRF